MEILRRKTMQGGSSATTDACSIEFYVANKDPFRVAPTNEIPVPYPYDRGRCSVEAHKIDSDLQRTILDVVRLFGITYRSMCVQKLWQRGFLHTAKDTVVITSYDKDPACWEEAANYIYEIVKNAAALAGITMRVEIQNPYEMYYNVSSAIRDEDVYRSLMQIEPIIKAQVKESCPSLWTSIAYHNRRRQYQDNSDSRDIHQPTVMVFVEPGSRSLWGLVEEQIYQAIKEVESVRDVKVALEILPGFNIPTGTPSCHHDSLPARLGIPAITPSELATGPAIFQRKIPAAPTNGSSIGPQRSTTESGSLGAVVYFQPHDQTARQRCFLTCYHVIAPGDPLGRRTNDELGIGLNGRAVGQNIRVNWPSRHDVIFTEKECLEAISKGEDNTGHLTKTLTTMRERFAATNSIGYVKHASGLRVNADNRRMDWALVVLDSPGLGDIKNEPPASSTFPASSFTLEFFQYEMDSTDPISRIGETGNHAWVGKCGRTTRATAGEVNLMRRSVRWADGVESTEAEALSLASGHRFAEGGDAGSLVFNLQKEWVGMLIGADICRDMGYITPVHDLIADIKATTGGTVTLV